MGVSRDSELWSQIVERDGGEFCQDCGYRPMQEARVSIVDGERQPVDANPLAADHVHPKSKGGATTLDNLQLRCARCNAAKSDRTPEEHSKTVRFAGDVWQQGFTMVPNIVLLEPRLSLAARMVYTQLIYYGWAKEDDWPGQVEFAQDLGISERSLRNHLAELEAAELIRSRRRGMGKTNAYIIAQPRPAKSAGQDRQDPTSQHRQNLPDQNKKKKSPSKGLDKSRPFVSPLSVAGAQALAVLQDMAERRGLTPPSPRAIARAIGDFPDRDPVAVANDLAYWAEEGKGARRTNMAIANTFRTFLKKPSFAESPKKRGAAGEQVTPLGRGQEHEIPCPSCQRPFKPYATERYRAGLGVSSCDACATEAAAA